MAGHHRILGVFASRPLTGLVTTRAPICALPRMGPLGCGAKELRESRLLPGSSCPPLIAVHPGLRQRLWIVVYSVAWGAPRGLLGLGPGLGSGIWFCVSPALCSRPSILGHFLPFSAFFPQVQVLESGTDVIYEASVPFGHFTDVDSPPHSRHQE